MSKPNYTYDFELFDRIWLNCAHQGPWPLPMIAVEAAEKALMWKVKPYHSDDESFQKIP